MKSSVKMPRVAETTDVVVVEEWLAEVGAVLAKDAPLLRVETDKVSIDVPSPIAGTLVEQLAAVDDEVTTGDAIAYIES